MDKYTRYLLFLNHIFYDSPSLFNEIRIRFPSQISFNQNKTSIINSLTKAKHQRFLYIDNQLDSVIQQLQKQKISLIHDQSALYPCLLKEIHDPPPILYFKGNINLLQTSCLSIVGTRTPSVYGKEITSHFTNELSNHFTIVSGLAAGIDAIAHKTCLNFNRPTIAIIGTGMNQIYPNHHHELHQEIANKGLILSEFPIHTKAFAHHFPQRNRIISGISKGTLICEGKHKSGSLITANYALEQNRDVFAIPGSIFSNLSEGPNKLIQEGAKLCQFPKDIFDEYGIKNTAKTSEKQTYYNLNDIENDIFEHIQKENNSIETLLESSGLPLSQLLQILSALELKKYITIQKNQTYLCIKKS